MSNFFFSISELYLTESLDDGRMLRCFSILKTNKTTKILFLFLCQNSFWVPKLRRAQKFYSAAKIYLKTSWNLWKRQDRMKSLALVLSIDSTIPKQKYQVRMKEKILFKNKINNSIIEFLYQKKVIYRQAFAQLNILSVEKNNYLLQVVHKKSCRNTKLCNFKLAYL